MNRKEYKLMVEGWRRLLNEEYGKFSAIDNLEKINKGSNDTYKLFIYEKNKTVYIAYDVDFYDDSRMGLDNSRYVEPERAKAVYGKTCAKPYTSSHNVGNKKGIGPGESREAYEIDITSPTLSGQGLGSLMYEVLIEYISSRKKAALKPDSVTVSSAAQKVWQKFNERSDIIKIQLDISDNDLNYINYMYPEAGAEKLTKNNPKDDVIMTAARNANDINSDGEWADSCLSKAYKKDNTELMDDLKSRGLLVIINSGNEGFFSNIIRRIFGN